MIGSTPPLVRARSPAGLGRRGGVDRPRGAGDVWRCRCPQGEGLPPPRLPEARPLQHLPRATNTVDAGEHGPLLGAEVHALVAGGSSLTSRTRSRLPSASATSSSLRTARTAASTASAVEKGPAASRRRGKPAGPAPRRCTSPRRWRHAGPGWCAPRARTLPGAVLVEYAHLHQHRPHALAVPRRDGQRPLRRPLQLAARDQDLARRRLLDRASPYTMCPLMKRTLRHSSPRMKRSIPVRRPRLVDLRTSGTTPGSMGLPTARPRSPAPKIRTTVNRTLSSRDVTMGKFDVKFPSVHDVARRPAEPRIHAPTVRTRPTRKRTPPTTSRARPSPPWPV